MVFESYIGGRWSMRYVPCGMIINMIDNIIQIGINSFSVRLFFAIFDTKIQDCSSLKLIN